MKRELFVFAMRNHAIGTAEISALIFVIVVAVLAFMTGDFYFAAQVATIMATIPAVGMLVIDYWARRKIVRYREVFDISVGRGSVAQSWIDNTLVSLAREMNVVFEMENEAIGIAKDRLLDGLTFNEVNDVLDRDSLVAWSRERSRKHKRYFWEAHKLARLMGFEVRKSFKDYLKLAA